MNKLVLTLFFLTGCIVMQAQDTLPKFSVKNIGGNRVIVEWFNKFETVKQISIQRSTDSTRNFKTIMNIADPSNPQNGYADTKTNQGRVFYRLYILLDKGVFLFSDAKSPIWDTASTKTAGNTAAIKRLTTGPDKPSLQLPVIPSDTTSKGSLVSGNKPKVEAWVPSKFVYTYKDGYIRISLPEEDKKYSIKFFTADDKLLFELKDIKERNFKLDKTNFYRSGWFRFELYEDGKLKEKNKFFLPKEF
jgi:hypothetical protein